MCSQPIQLPRFANRAQQGESGETEHGLESEHEASAARSSQVRSSKVQGRTLRWAASILVSLFLLVTVLVIVGRYGSQGLQVVQSNRMRGQCMQNLEKLAAALKAYEQDYGTLPPPALVAADGTPLLSWRVLLLPYLNRRDLYDEFRLNEPWSSTHNSALMLSMPEVFRSPAGINVTGAESHYSMIVGAGTLFPASGPMRLGEVRDGLNRTLLLVEIGTPTAPSSQWTEPGEIDLSQLNAPVGVAIGGNHDGGATVVTADGRAHFLSDSVSASVLQALATPSGGEGIANDVLD
jgi:hypothetical protein